MKCRLIRHPGQASHSDEVLARFGAATELPLRKQVANALVNKGGTLDALDQSEDAIAVYDDVLARFGAATELPLREQVSRAQLNKASMQNSCRPCGNGSGWAVTPRRSLFWRLSRDSARDAGCEGAIVVCMVQPGRYRASF